jgi:hypothetical protein
MHERKVTHLGRCPDSRVASITLIVVSFALFSVFLLGTAVVANKAGEGAWPYRPVVFLPGILALVKFGIAFRSCDPKRRRQFWRSVLATAFAFAGIFAAIEIGLRWCAVSSELGERIGTTELLPHEWQHVRRVNLELLRQFEDENAFFVEDAVFGWDVGKGRKTGAYASSAEGIRSASPGER